MLDDPKAWGDLIPCPAVSFRTEVRAFAPNQEFSTKLFVLYRRSTCPARCYPIPLLSPRCPRRFDRWCERISFPTTDSMDPRRYIAASGFQKSLTALHPRVSWLVTLMGITQRLR